MALQPLRSAVAVDEVIELAALTDRIIEDGVVTDEEAAEYAAQRAIALEAVERADGAVRGAMSLLRAGDYTPGLLRYHRDVLPPLPKDAA